MKNEKLTMSKAARLLAMAVVLAAAVFAFALVISCKNDDEHTHDSGEWITTLEPTCTEAGSKELRCTVDGAVLNTDAIEALGHDWIDNWQTTAPTCTETGGEKRTCNRINCTETQSQNETTALGHDSGIWHTTLEPNCTIAGSKELRCTVDNVVLDTDTITALGHDSGIWHTTLEPNCTIAGSKELRCTVDNAVLDTSTITALGHNIIGSYICSVCNNPYELGDIGPGGGKIFYRNVNGFTMTDDNSTAYYLEAASNDIPTSLRWVAESFGDDDSSFPDITGTSIEIGTGRKNTALILATDVNAPAAKACNEYTNNGKNDWFLPSIYELREIYTNINIFDNLETGYTSYWSSSQYDYRYAWRQAFINNGIGGDPKERTYLVRAIRAF